MLDTNIITEISKIQGLEIKLKESVNNDFELLITHIQMDEIQQNPHEKTKNTLVDLIESIPIQNVPTSMFVVGVSRAGAARVGGGDP